MRSVHENTPPSRPLAKHAKRAARPRARVAAEADGAEGWTYEVAHADGSADLAPVVGKNLRRLRVQRGLSLEKLSKASGVSRAMLGQVELGQSAPTINVLWKIARALGVPFSGLITQHGGNGTRVIRATQSKLLASHDGRFTSRALFPFDEPRRVELYELHLAGRSSEAADPHPPGTTENLVLAAGTLELEVAAERHVLTAGDAILFQADVPHLYRNPGSEQAVMYLVMTYADTVG